MTLASSSGGRWAAASCCGSFKGKDHAARRCGALRLRQHARERTGISDRASPSWKLEMRCPIDSRSRACALRLLASLGGAILCSSARSAPRSRTSAWVNGPARGSRSSADQSVRRADARLRCSSCTPSITRADGSPVEREAEGLVDGSGAGPSAHAEASAHRHARRAQPVGREGTWSVLRRHAADARGSIQASSRSADGSVGTVSVPSRVAAHATERAEIDRAAARACRSAVRVRRR
jgi:hypothetical protein